MKYIDSERAFERALQIYLEFGNICLLQMQKDLKTRSKTYIHNIIDEPVINLETISVLN